MKFKDNNNFFVQIILLLVSLYFFNLFFKGVKYEINFLNSKIETEASVNSVKYDELEKEYQVEIIYFNDYIKKDIKTIAIAKNFKSIDVKKIKIFYASKNPYKVHINGNPMPNLTDTFLNTIILILAICGIINSIFQMLKIVKHKFKKNEV